MTYTADKLRELLEGKTKKVVEHTIEPKEIRGTIHSSYFGKLDKIYDEEFVYLAICRFKPKYIKFQGNIVHLPVLAPSKELVLNAKNNGIEHKAFTHFYYKEITSFMMDEIDKLIAEIDKGVKICLLCYEKSDDFCHRHILCKFLKDKYNIEQIEL